MRFEPLLLCEIKPLEAVLRAFSVYWGIHWETYASFQLRIMPRIWYHPVSYEMVQFLLLFLSKASI
jgi:hypothetical protein